MLIYILCFVMIFAPFRQKSRQNGFRFSFLPRVETRGYYCSTPSGFRIIPDSYQGLCAKIYHHECFMCVCFFTFLIRYIFKPTKAFRLFMLYMIFFSRLPHHSG